MLAIAIRKSVIFGVLLVILAGALPMFAQTGGIEGVCTDEKGNLMVGHLIVLDRLDVKGNYKTKTDKHGHYIYIGLPLGRYKITLESPTGQEIYHFNGIHIGMGDPMVQDFNMAKERKAEAAEAKSNPAVQAQVAEQKKEQTQFAGLKGMFSQGQALYADKKYAEAAAAFEQAIPLAKDKNLIVVLGRLADCYAKANQFDKALENYQKALALSPDDAELHNGLGNVYAQTGKIPEAMAEFQKSATLNPAGASQAYFNLGVVMYNKGQMDDAADAFKKATTADANYADAYFWMGLALMGKATMQGEKMVVPSGTLEALQTYLKLQPTGPNAPAAQQMLQTIQSQVETELKVAKKKKK